MVAYAQEQNKPELVNKIQQNQKNAESEVTEEELIDRFNEYHIAVTDILGSQHALEAVTVAVSNQDATRFTDKFKSFFKIIKDTCMSALSKLYRTLVGIKDNISQKIQSIIDNLDNWIRDKVHMVFEKIHKIISSLSNFFSNALSKILKWAATVKRIAPQNDFALKSVKISIEPAEVRTIPYSLSHSIYYLQNAKD